MTAKPAYIGIYIRRDVARLPQEFLIQKFVQCFRCTGAFNFCFSCFLTIKFRNNKSKTCWSRVGLLLVLVLGEADSESLL